MFLSDFSIKRPLVTVVLILAAMCMGLVALSKLRVNQNPDVELPGLQVHIAYPGASPDTVEREVINRIEKSLQGLPGVVETRALAAEGSATISIRFGFKKNLIEASDDVRNAIAGVRYKLPLEMREPTITRWDTSAQPIMNLALSSSSRSHADISRLAEDTLADRLRAIDGVASVNVTGALRRELSVLLRAEKLREYGVSAGEVVAALRGQNASSPVGKLSDPMEENSIRLAGRIESPGQFEQVVVKRRGDDVVRLGQLAQVEDGAADITSLSIRNGKPNVSLSVVRARDASTVAVAERVRAIVKQVNAEFQKSQPGTVLEVTQDGGVDAQDSLDNVIESLVFGAVLTIFVVYAFLNSWRSTLITALSLPTSVVAAFIAVWLCGFTLNFMTLLGLSLAIGVLIDDAIVVRENIVRHMQRGSDRRTAALEGTAEIGLAVAATTFSIIAVFIPVAFMPGVAGEWFRPFALTVTCSVLVSLLISFTLDPMLSAYWGDPQAHQGAPDNWLGRTLGRFNDWFDRQGEGYGRVVGWALEHRRAMGVLAVVSLAGALLLQAKFGGTSFLPAADHGALIVDVRTPPSSSIGYAKLKLMRAAELAAALPETRATDVSIHAGGGQVHVDLGASGTRQRSAKEVATDLRARMQRLVGAEYVVLDDLNNDGGKPVQIQFSGPDVRRLTETAQAFMVKLRQVPGAVDVGLSEQGPKKELQIELQRGLANSMGISASDAALALRVAFAGVEVGDWIDPTGEARDVAVRLHPDDRMNAASIARLPVAAGPGSAMVPLEQIATISMGTGPSTIQHSNGNRIVTVSANVQGRSDGEVTDDALKLAATFDFPPGYGLALQGSGKDQKEVFSAMFIALLSGIGLMYLILVIQFGSFTAPLAVMLSLPLSLIGVVLALILTGSTLNLMSFIGIIMLMGLVAKNAILLLDAARARAAEGHTRRAALIYAGQLRLRPILMTTFALIAGMFPVALGLGTGGEFYQPLAIAIIGGTITSTILTLLVVPAFYESIEGARERAGAKFQRRAGRGNTAVALLATLAEALLALLMVRLLYRVASGGVRRLARR